jgi:hypothetical protein
MAGRGGMLREKRLLHVIYAISSSATFFWNINVG